MGRECEKMATPWWVQPSRSQEGKRPGWASGCSSSTRLPGSPPWSNMQSVSWVMCLRPHLVLTTTTTTITVIIIMAERKEEEEESCVK